MSSEASVLGWQDPSSKIIIRFDGFPIWTSTLDFAIFMETIASKPNILFPRPKSSELFRPCPSDPTVHALLEFDWTSESNDEQAERTFSDVLEACHRLEAAGLTLADQVVGSSMTVNQIKPTLILPTSAISAPNGRMPSHQLKLGSPVALESFSAFIRSAKKRPGPERIGSESDLDDLSNLDTSALSLALSKSEKMIEGAEYQAKLRLTASKLHRIRSNRPNPQQTRVLTYRPRN